MVSEFIIVRDSAIDVGIGDDDFLHTIAVQIIIDGKSYLDGTVPNDLYEMAIRDTTITTSQPSPEQFDRLYEKLDTQNLPILSIHISKELSGTYNSARLAAKEHPHVHLFDTESASIGSGYFVNIAKECRDYGMSIEQTIELLNLAKNYVSLLIVVDNIDHLHRSGRINFVLKGFLKFLHLIPILTTLNGKLERKALTLGKSNAIKRLISEAKSVDSRQYQLIIGGTTIIDNTNLLNPLHDVFSNVQTIYIGKALEVHTGPGAVGILLGPRLSFLQNLMER